MTPKERAEKILAYICPDTNLPRKDLEFIEAQIEEAEREAVLYSAPYAEGFKVAREKAAKDMDNDDLYYSDAIRRREEK